ncbi:hypothetical protein JCM10212_006576 [Sporobolomyces blumeae]
MPDQVSVHPGVHVSTSDALASTSSTDLDEHWTLSLRLIDAILDDNDHSDLVESLVVNEKVDCWIQDRQGWSSLHAAAYVGNVDLIKLLLRKGNAVWNLVDNLGCSAADIAYSMNHRSAYEFLLAEGVRAEMLRAVMEDVAVANELDEDRSDDGDRGQDETRASDRQDDGEGDDSSAVTGKVAGTVEPNESAVGRDAAMTDVVDRRDAGPSTASDLAHYLSRPLRFVTDRSGQEIALDEEGNGVMMGWERPIMERTVDAMLAPGWSDRKGKSRQELVESEERDETEPLKVVNVGFGLGIVRFCPLLSFCPSPAWFVSIHPLENAWVTREN